jgi:hypothetical protein
MLVGLIYRHTVGVIVGWVGGIAAMFGVVEGITPTTGLIGAILSLVAAMVVLVFKSQQGEIASLRLRVRYLEQQDANYRTELKAKIRELEERLES